MAGTRRLVALCCIVAFACALDGEDLATLGDATEQGPEEPPPEEMVTEVGEETAAGEGGPPPQVMLGTSGYFRMASKDKVPQFFELGEAPSTAGGKHADERISLAEAAKILSVVGEAADAKATVSRNALDTLIRRATKERMLGDGHLVQAQHQNSLKGIMLGEGAAATGGFRFTNGAYGANGGKEKWLKCESPCQGTGYGGYGWCSVNGEGSPWGGCMAPGSDPAVERPPKLYSKNRITTTETPRAHMFCDAEEGGDVWMKSRGKLVAGCSNCVNEDYFMVPNHHVENMMVGTCFKISQYQGWVDAVQKAMQGETAPLECSVFTNDKGMRTQYFGNAEKDQWDSAPKDSSYNPRAFLCTSAGKVHDNTVNGMLEKGYREMKVFSTIVARFVMCHSDSADGAGMKCVKKTRIGTCESFYVRNAAFDQAAFHLPSPAVNQTGIDWEAETRTWDDKALNLAATKLMEGGSAAIGMHACDQSWHERILAVHQ